MEKRTVRLKKGGFFLEQIRNKVNPVDAESLKQPISIEEIKIAVFSMKDKKAPGIDGIPIEFYKTFWSLINETLREIFSEALESGSLCQSQKISAISLVHKGGEKDEIRNYRPLRLLCADYKILAKTITNRLKPILELTIEPEQKGGLNGRQITDNPTQIRTALQAIEHQNMHTTARGRRNKEKGAAIIGLDYEKAYDRVEGEFLFQVMEKMEYPVEIIDWIKTLYNGTKARMIVNGEMGEGIECERGIKQGCPLSMYLYIIYIEPLLQKFNMEIAGLTLDPQTTLRICGFVDDIVICVEKDSDFKIVNNIVNEFEKATNAKVNRDKTKLMGFGGRSERERWSFDWLKNY